MSTSTTGPTEPKGSEPSSKPEPLCLCGHPLRGHFPPPLGANACKTCACQRYEADAPKEESPHPDLACDCGHPAKWHTNFSGACNRFDEEKDQSCRCEGFAELEHPDEPTFVQDGTPEPERKAPPRRPPYAVTYATRSRDFQVLTPGDCSVSVVDGALVIRHIEPVTGVTAVQPYYTKEG